MKYITPEGLQKLKEELVERKTTKRQEIAQRLEEAKALGDLTENTEYATAKEAQAFNEGRILELEAMIRDAVVVSQKSRRQTEGVQIGSVVEVKLINQKQSRLSALLKGDKSTKKVFTIVGSHEAHPTEGKISNESPLGQAFLNHQVGDIIEAETPKGKVRYKIVSIK